MLSARGGRSCRHLRSFQLHQLASFGELDRDRLAGVVLFRHVLPPGGE
jgi:hypothetical protein